jgi:polar amino acid transport system substrate-binding protein
MKYKPMLVAATTLVALVASACGGGANQSQAPSTGPESANFGAVKDQSAAALVPADLHNKTLQNAVYNDYPPEMYLDAGKITGIQVDLSNAIATVLDVKIQNVGTGAFDNIIPGLASGRYDLAASAFGITPERVKQVDFVPHFDIGTGFAVKSGGSLNLASRSDLCGHSVAVLQGSYFAKQVEAIGTECTGAGRAPVQLNQFPAASAGVLALQNGRVDVYAASQDSLAFQAKQNKFMSIQKLVDAVLPQGIAFPKNSGLTNAAVAAMKVLYTTGVYAKILQKWDIGSLGYPDVNAFQVNRTVAYSS